MATTESWSAQAPPSARGRIFDLSTKKGMGGLLVTAYNIAVPSNRSSGEEPGATLKSAARLGSVLSDSDGHFLLTYDDSADGSVVPRNKSSVNLMLVVSAPDDEKSHSSQKIIYQSNPPRLNAAKQETFNIGISSAAQRDFGLGSEVTAEESISSYKYERASEKELSDAIAEHHSTEVRRDIDDKAAMRKELLRAVATDTDLAPLTGEVVGENGDIKEKLRIVASNGLDKANIEIGDGTGVRVNLYFTPADRQRLAPYFDNAVDGLVVIPENQLEDILFRSQSSEDPGTLMVNQSPIAKYCAEQTFDEKCAKMHTGIDHEAEDHAHGDTTSPDSGDPSGTVAGPGIETLANDDIPKYAAKLIASAPSPDSVLNPELNSQRADKDAVEAAVESFSLRRGPAEVPAFYDFHSLQIAFEHVWKYLFDEEIVNATHEINKQYSLKTGVNFMHELAHDFTHLPPGALVYESIPTEVPADVAAQFDITKYEWTDLSTSHQKKLRDIAALLEAGCEAVKVFKFGGATFTVTESRLGTLSCQKKQQKLREQGDRLIDAVRHDDYFTLHKTLGDLHDRISANYEFTVFAADRSYHSVNFGLLNTYRQQWTPLNYQAGKLVKTIPLSPKEERKYALKVTRNIKRTSKEALKNNSSLTTEQSTSSRVEAEIMSKVQNKSDFEQTGKGDFDIGIWKAGGTTTFGVEAAKESSESRKDFREAVLKAVQDYKEERSVEINAEEVESYEVTESGTVLNPNDELSVTYLFYELQKRYRISEQLYRALPVVLVAEEVPAPDEITESWIIANDWILNRSLLDDSFRPALNYLANKSVGDDFALRELRKNLRQQRNLVDTLTTEMAMAGDEAANRYAALESAIAKRIGEESAESTDGWFSDVTEFFGGGGQDPEAAKARELAAKDAHQHAVERAEKASAALRLEVNSLHRLTTEYNEALRTHLDNETRVKRLLVHIRNNVLYYMQAIWRLEPPDQRFLRLHKVEVPELELSEIPNPDTLGAMMPDRHYVVDVNAVADVFEDFREPGTTKHRAFMKGSLAPITKFRPLVEVADLDTVLGFKGNYVIFPLKVHNALTEFMAAPYVDSAFGAMDPDELTNVNLLDYGKYICCLHERLPIEKFDALKPQLRKWLELLLSDPLRNGDEIVVPANSLFIEVLAGTHPLLENFKLRHRELDVFNVQASVRKAELENLRMAARLVNDEREDPDVEKKIVIEGLVNPNIDVDNS